MTQVETIEPEDAESMVDGWPNNCWSAKRINFDDGDCVIVIIYGRGPTQNIRDVEAAIDKIS